MNFLRKIKNNLIKKYIDYIVSQKKKDKTSSFHYKNSTTKHSMNESCTMELSSITEQKKAELDLELKEVVRKYFNSPEKLIQYIKTIGGSVYKIKNAEKLLSKIGEEEGFITPLRGFKALFINIITGLSYSNKLKISFKTKELFIFDVNNTEIYTIARALYKYYGFKNNLPGYDYNSQETFKKVYNKRHHSSPFNNCSINDMYACKEAIARDMESINFTLDLSVEYENSKKALDKIKENNSANI